ncbi:MAG: serine hydrolase [Bacteroidota bacterium]
MRNIKPTFLLLLFTVLASTESAAYPIDGYFVTGIRRLLYLHRVQTGEIKGKMPISGAQRTMDEIQLNLYGTDRADSLRTLPDIDPDLQKDLKRLLPNLDASYSLTLLEITPNKPVRYAAYKEERGYQPGSVGKLAVLTAIFCELENLFPDSFEKRRALLKNRMVKGGDFAVWDHHSIPVFDTLTNRKVKRQATQKDIFSLYEWIDHMVSVSNNGAASVVWREAILMREFNQDYLTLTEAEANKYFEATARKKLADMAVSVVHEPLRSLGITDDEWRLGTMFTRGASSIVPPKGGSVGTPKALMKWMLALERGDINDPETSLEMKRLLYMTDRRIRYAGEKSLRPASVYYKSGSLYKCDREKDPDCKKYAGNVYNYMNSVAIVERPDSTVYMVALMTNVLRRNSAWDHRVLARKIDQLFPPQEEVLARLEKQERADSLAEVAAARLDSIELVREEGVELEVGSSPAVSL